MAVSQQPAGRDGKKGGNRMGGGSRLRMGCLLLWAFLVQAGIGTPARAASPAFIVVRDKLCHPGEEVYIEAGLYRTGLFGLYARGVPGEVLCFADPQGKPLRNLLTDPSGAARARYEAGPAGRYRITVRLADNPRCSAEPAVGSLFVVPRGTPLFFVLVEEGLLPEPATPWPVDDLEAAAPERGSVEALSAIAACRMTVYLTRASPVRANRIRSWLEARGYPPGPVCFLERPGWGEMFSEPVPPNLEPVDSLWKERSVPAYLLTRAIPIAEAAAGKGMNVLLLVPDVPREGAPPEGGGPHREDGDGANGQMVRLRDWSEVAAACPCKPEPRGGPLR